MRSFAIYLAFMVAILTPSASAWGIGFYSGTNCMEDPHFNAAFYNGDSQSDCRNPGEPCDGCEWNTDSGQTSSECTQNMNPGPGSFYMSQGTTCWFGMGSTDPCLLFDTKWTELPVEECLTIQKVPGYNDNQPVVFVCWDAVKD